MRQRYGIHQADEEDQGDHQQDGQHEETNRKPLDQNNRKPRRLEES
jgi:hypothetical protein